MPNEIPAILHNGSKCDYHFIIKELVNEFKGQFEYSGEKTKICKSFSVPIKKEIRKIDKEGSETIDTISYRIKFIDSMRFMATSLSNLVDNLTEGIRKIRCKDFNCFLEYESVKNSLIKYKCLSCNKDFQPSLMKNYKRNSRIYLSFPGMTSINLFC